MPTRPVAIVTGAGSGIGRAVAVLLAEAGFNVTLAARTRASLDETAAMIGGGAKPLVVPTDLTNATATRALVPATLSAFGRLDAIANVAGYAPMCPVDELTPEVIQRCFDTNIAYAINLVAAAWPQFKSQKAGVIANVSSMASIDPFPGFAAYAPAKAAVNMFTSCIAREGAPLGIRAVAIAPGTVETPMLRSLFGKNQIPTEKTLAPEKIAAVVVGCICGTHPFASGETIAMPSP